MAVAAAEVVTQQALRCERAPRASLPHPRPGRQSQHARGSVDILIPEGEVNAATGGRPLAGYSYPSGAATAYPLMATRPSPLSSGAWI